MERDKKVKSHVRISAIIVVLAYIISSYIFGTFNHDLVSKHDRQSVIVITISCILIANYLYYESYTKKSDE